MKTREILIRLWRLLKSPAQEWEAIAREELPMKTVRKHYILLPLLLCMAVGFVCGICYAPAHHRIETATAALLSTGIILVGTYALSLTIGTQLVCRTGISVQQTDSIHTLITYAMSVIFLIDLLTSLMPQAGYLQIAALYCGWLLHTGCKVMLPDSEEQHNTIVAILTLCIAGLPFLLRLALKLLLPNL